MGIKYPEQVGSIKRKDKVLGVDAKLCLPTNEEVENSDVSPLEMHSGFSRFVLTILDKSNGGFVTPKANLPAQEMAYVAKKTEVAMHKILDTRLAGTVASGSGEENGEEETKGLAYTQKMLGKTFNGKTPAEILLADPSQKDALIKQKAWLNENLAKYAANANQIKAIDEAITLLETGKLSAADTKPIGKTFEIYSADHKFFSNKNEKGYNQIYSLTITCDPTMDYPFIISIFNCFAPVESTKFGGKNVKMAQAEDKVQTSLKVNEIEWCGLVDRMSKTLENFEQMNFAKQYEVAKKNSWHPNTEKVS